MKKKQSIKTDNGRYEQFLRGLNVFGIALLKSQSQIERPKYYELLDRRKKAARSLTASYELSAAGKDFFDATATFRLKIRDQNLSKDVLSIESVFEIHFHVKEPVQKDLAQRFVDSDLQLIVWPYFRQFVFDATSRMSIPPVTVPLLTEP